MPLVTKEEILSKIGELWLVELRESERGWGGSTWQETYTSYDEAHRRYMQVNEGNPTDHVPDYYVVASKPRKATLTFS